MSLAILIWFINSVDAIGKAFIGLTIVSTIFSIVCFINAHDVHTKNENKPGWVKWTRGWFISMLVCLTVATLMPSTKTAWMMAGGYATQTVVQSETAKKFGKIIELKLEDILEEASKEAKGKIKKEISGETKSGT